ncbi:MAG: methyltransferase domain-containing protein [Siphonobacter sp.]
MNQLLRYFNFQPGETIVSLGCGGGVWEIGFGTTIDHLTFYLVEQNAEVLNSDEIQAGIQFWEKQLQKVTTSHFIPVINTETNIPLPDQIADKALILNALHEFSFPEPMLKEVRRILKFRGKVFIEEEIATQVGVLHEGCGKPLFTETALQTLVTTSGFYKQQEWPTTEIARLFCYGNKIASVA